MGYLKLTGQSHLQVGDSSDLSDLSEKVLYQTDRTLETVARRRSAALLSEFGLGHVREYAPFGLILSALHLILRATFSTMELLGYPLKKPPRFSEGATHIYKEYLTSRGREYRERSVAPRR